MFVYAQINKNTLKFIRDEKSVSYEYIERMTKIEKTWFCAKTQLTN